MTPTANGSRHRGRLPGRPLLLAPAALALAVLAGGVWWSARRQPIPEPPSVPLAGLDAAVARSIEQARAQVGQSPRSGAAWGRLGMVLGAANFRPQAASCFAVAERLEPSEPRWPYFRGLALQREGAEAEAVPPLRRAAELCGGDPDSPRLRLADLLLKGGRLEEAEGQFRGLLAADPGHPPAHLGLARLAVARNDPRAARDRLSHCLGSPFARQAAYRLLAEVRLRLGDRAAAREALGQAASLPPDLPWPDPFQDQVEELKAERRLLVRRALGLRGRGRVEEAQQILQELESDYPGTSAFLEGRRSLDAGDFKAAEQAFREAVRLGPDFAQAHYWLGVALWEQGDAGNAAASFRAALKIQPRHAAAYEQLGVCLERLGDRPGAIDALRASARLLPQEAAVHRRLGTLLAGAGHDAEALVHLQRALSLQEDPKTRELLGQVRKRQAPEGR